MEKAQLVVDRDVQMEFLRRAAERDKSSTDLLQELLKLDPKPRTTTVATVLDPIAQLIESPRYRAIRSATDRYLAVLGAAYKNDPEAFESVLQISGRNRVYFARTRDEIAKAGRSTHPRQIPGSTYWALTNADTSQKRDILRRVLVQLGFTSSTATSAAASIA